MTYLHPGLRRLRRKRHRQKLQRLVDRPLRATMAKLLEKRVRVSDYDLWTWIDGPKKRVIYIVHKKRAQNCVKKQCCNKLDFQRHQSRSMTRRPEKTAAMTRLLQPLMLLTTRAKKSPQWALSRYQVPTKACYCRNNSTRIAYLDENKSFSRNWWISYYYLVYVRQFCQKVMYHTMWSPK